MTHFIIYVYPNDISTLRFILIRNLTFVIYFLKCYSLHFLEFFLMKKVDKNKILIIYGLFFYI